MKRGVFLLLCMFTLNVSTMFVNSIPLFDGVTSLDPFSPDQITEALNASEMQDRWDPPESGGLFGDVKATLQNLKRLDQFIVTFPSMWSELGLPQSLVNIFSSLWSFIWWLSILDFISGGKIFGV